MDVIETLRKRNAQTLWAVQTEGRMIDILEEALCRLRREGYSPALALGECGALVTLRLDTSVWALRQVKQVAVPEAAAVPEGAAPAAAEVPARRAVTIDYSTFWTPAKDKQLLKLRGDGLSGRQIAAELGTTLPAVEKRMWKMRRTGFDVPPAKSRPGLANAGKAVFPAWTPERDAKLIELRGAGRTVEQIAAELGTTVPAVGTRVSKLRRAGHDVPEAVRAPHRPFATPSVRVDGVVLREWTAEDDAALVAAYASGRKTVDVAQDMGRSFSAVTKRLTHLRNAGAITHHRAAVPSENLWSDARRQELRDLWPVMKVADIAARFGVSTGSVSGMAFRMKLGLRARTGVGQKSEPKAGVAEAAPVVVHKTSAVGKSTDVAKSFATGGVAKGPGSLPLMGELCSDAVDGLAAPAPAPITGPSAGFVAAAARPMTVNRVAVRLSADMTATARAEAVKTHVQQLVADANFDAEADLELCEAVFGGKGGLQMFATDFGLDAKVALARFDLIVKPFRQPGEKHLPIDTAGLLLPALRERVKAARGVAA